MKKTLSFGILTIGIFMLVGMIRSRQNEERKNCMNGKNRLFDSINDNPIGI